MLGALVYKKSESVLIDIDEDQNETARYEVQQFESNNIKFDEVCFCYDDFDPLLGLVLSNCPKIAEQIEQAKIDSNTEIGALVFPSGNRVLFVDSVVYDWTFNFVVED